MNEEENFLEQNEFKEKIKKIESLKIGSIFQANLVLVLLGEKPSTDLYLYKWNQDKEDVVNILNEIGFSIFEKVSRSVSNDNLCAILCISMNVDLAEELSKTSSSINHTRYGELMGYPESAIKAFIEKDRQLPVSQCPNLREKGIIFDLKLSKENFEEEIRHLERWSIKVKEYAPEVYEKILGNI